MEAVSEKPKLWFDPESGQKLNVINLVNALKEFDAPEGAPLGQGAAEAIRRIIRALNVTKHDSNINNPELIVDLYHDLHRLEDMFNAIGHPSKDED